MRDFVRVEAPFLRVQRLAVAVPRLSIRLATLLISAYEVAEFRAAVKFMSDLRQNSSCTAHLSCGNLVFDT